MVRLLISSEDPAVHWEVTAHLKSGLEKELGQEVVITEKYSAQETLSVVTDSVFELVILDHSYAKESLKSRDLIREIKHLDRTIPILILSKTPAPLEIECLKIEGAYCYPLTESQIKLLTLLFTARAAAHAKAS